jgi:hypothetical protein
MIHFTTVQMAAPVVASMPWQVLSGPQHWPKQSVCGDTQAPQTPPLQLPVQQAAFDVHDALVARQRQPSSEQEPEQHSLPLPQVARKPPQTEMMIWQVPLVQVPCLQSLSREHGSVSSDFRHLNSSAPTERQRPVQQSASALQSRSPVSAGAQQVPCPPPATAAPSFWQIAGLSHWLSAVQPARNGSFLHTPGSPFVELQDPLQHWVDPVQAAPAAEQQMETPLRLTPH